MCTRLSVQIKFTEIESMLFSNTFQWRIHVLDEEGDTGGLSTGADIQRYIAKTSHIRLPIH